ncbi:hypothetical protein ACLFMI_11350 [Pseudonocardia nantongensis]|uniref:hypothetical protein n=1 Tax=Pseudonocardia nantongensis TaxID=1181885 RepID=UPI00397DB9B1
MLARSADAAADIGVGVLAGALGTVAMTLSSTTEMTISGRGASSSPEDAAGTVLGVQPSSEAGQKRFGTLVHWGYGTAWGAVRGLLSTAGLRGPAATLAHFGLVWGGEQVVMPFTGAGRPTPAYGASATATDVLHHAVYAAATSAAYEWLDRSRTR